MHRTFTRKHYVALAKIIREYILEMPVDGQEYLTPFVHRMGAAFRVEYPEFDEQRFLKLCGLID